MHILSCPFFFSSPFHVRLSLTSLFFFNLLILEGKRRGGGERERAETETWICFPSTYALIGFSLHVPCLEIDPAILAYWGDAPIN